MNTLLDNHDLTAPYNLYPAWPLDRGTIDAGYDALASQLRGHRTLRVDGYVGVEWEVFRGAFQRSMQQLGTSVRWIDISNAMKTAGEINTLLVPFLGGDDPVFGTRYRGELSDFFVPEKLRTITPDDQADCTIVYGPGASLIDWDGPLVYVDLPKYELQLRSRRGAVCNLGADEPIPPKPQYKRFYFVDWPVLNRRKLEILADVDWFVDDQQSGQPTFMRGDAVRAALEEQSRNALRARPWFEPGPWGGQWMKQRIPELPQAVANYAWSFEFITPENGLMFEDGDHRLEVSFDWLMYGHGEAVLGDHYCRFGYEFPIRFDFLDTFEGGNLSVQCHPRPDYIQEHFGESFTQDETYYILDAAPDAKVFLGFVEGVNGDRFKQELLTSAAAGTEVHIDRYVQSLPARKHDLFLIPHGTVHCSGTGNLVLEISATPYIFTFKMYDWMRMGLDGQPRPLNIERAMDNLMFERQGSQVAATLVSHPSVVDEGDEWQLIHLPTHELHFYDVHRYEFNTAVTGHTHGSPLVMMLVEGTSIEVGTGDRRQQFNFAETFMIPAAAASYSLTNLGDRRAKVVVASLKPPCG